MAALIHLPCAYHLRFCSKNTLFSREENPIRKNLEKVEMNQWWKKSVGQSLNSAGVASFLSVATKKPHLALPHISVPDVRWIDWSELERLGFRGVVFDKDNTLTAPYSLSLWPALSGSFVQCQAAFPGKVAVFSNSAELKKPDGTAEDIEKFFGCPVSDLIMVGDRYFTDIVYGNRNGFLTILTEPLTLSLEPFIVKQVRKLEGYLVKHWHHKGLKPAKHMLLPEFHHCINSSLS
ncbi:hypothetical protein MA16_Dca000826 [Dendrobium catenatum]|uniref:Phosphatidylglycerophosphatase GEP4, mitochondrial n=1 Tax=Dendrobium catenatum TaxID=906689 RepID=A0A2I0WUZ3_9ASPA|nr:hypothetical protein MA16_Dca000826 [Dendrobium catenatum]